jgi:hypothetical protein
VGFGPCDVGDVDGVLGVDGATEIAAGEVLTALLFHPAEGMLASLPEVNGDRQRARLAADMAAGGSEGRDLGQSRIIWRHHRLQRLLGLVVPGVETFAVDGVGPALVEDIGGGPQLHVGVDKRAAADAGCSDHRDVAHHSQVEEPLWVELLVPEHLRGLLWLCGEILATEAPAALEHADSLAGFGETASGDTAAEARADHHRVVGLRHSDGLRLSEIERPVTGRSI